MSSPDLAGLAAPLRSSGQVTWLRTHGGVEIRDREVRQVRLLHAESALTAGETYKLIHVPLASWVPCARTELTASRAAPRAKAPLAKGPRSVSQTIAWQRFSSHSLNQVRTSETSGWKSSFSLEVSTAAVVKLSTRIAPWRFSAGRRSALVGIRPASLLAPN